MDIEKEIYDLKQEIKSIRAQGLVADSAFLTESDFPQAGIDQIVVHNGTNQVVGYFPATSDGLDAAIGSAGSGDAIWLPACIIGDDHSVPAGVSLIGVGRYVSILTGQITLANGAALISLSILRSGTSSLTAVVVSGGSAYINSCKLSVVLTAGTAYLVSPYGNAYLLGCELVCTVNGANVSPYEGLRNLTYTFDSTLQGWAFVDAQVAYTTGAVGMTASDASVLTWNSGKLRFTVPANWVDWKYGTAFIDVSSRNFVITQDSVLSFTVSESYSGNSYYGARIEFTDGTSQAFSNMWTGGAIDDAHIGKVIKKIYVGYLVANMYNPRTIDFDNVVITNVGGDVFVHACSGISAYGTYLTGDRAVFDALTAPSQHANDIDVAAGLHHTIGNTTGKAADGGVVNNHINNTSNPHSVTKAQVGLGNVSNVLCNLAATTAPGVGDDSADGYSVGSLWIDTTNDKFYICIDATVGAAIWRNYALTVQEVDGSPLVTNVKAIKFTNGSVTDNGDGTVTVNVGGAGGSITIQEQDGSPSASFSTLKVPNGTLTDEGGGIASFVPGGTGNVVGPASSVDAHLAVFDGTDGKKIKDGGAVLTMGLVLLAQLTASNSASLDFSSAISSSYDEYLIELVNILPVTNGVTLYMRLGNGSYDSGATNYNRAGWYNGVSDTLTNWISSGESGLRIADSVRNDSNNMTLNGTVRLFKPGSTASYKQIISDASSFAVAAGRVYRWCMTGAWLNYSSAADRFQFLFSSGNISSGTIRVYGVAK